MKGARRPLLLACFLVVSGCGSEQSTLDPASDASREIADLWWIMLVGATIVVAVVVLLVLVAVLGRAGRRDSAARDSRRARGLVLAGGAVLPLVALPLLMVLTVRTLPATSAPAESEAELTVEVVGQQWFWEARYPGTEAVTANEIHIPARTPVEVRVRTVDVIHSFWVPRLNRKIDLIPGRENSVLLEADRPGTYRGQCAEFCGLQHANMAFTIVAEEPAEFRRWLERQAAPAEAAGAGLELFLGEGCGGCHTIRGTEADGTAGPDLTHVAGRETLAALTVPNTKGWLATWVFDPQHVKPGNKMPKLDLSRRELFDLVAYLEELE